jgi:sugar (pentulose or hexulose) kinase
VNVNALGDPTPSARFMGGREYEIVRAGRDFSPDPGARARALDCGLMLLPAVEPGFGPFRGRIGGWTAPPCDPGAEAVALGFYLALVTAEALELLGAQGPVVVEGPFAGNADYLDMLAAATGRAVIAASGGATGTAVGAALLAGGAPTEAERRAAPRRTAGLGGYLGEWRRRTAAGEAAVERVGTAVEP